MKIGPVNLTIPTLVSSGLLVVLSIAVFELYRGSSARRAEGRLEGRIRACAVDAKPARYQEGIDLCADLLKVAPGCVPAHLYMATFQYEMGKHAEAHETYAAAAKLVGASKHHAALACIGAGVSLFSATPAEKRSPVFGAVEDHFKKALELDPEQPDARANLAILTLWKGAPGAPQKAVAEIGSVINGATPPGRYTSARMYNALGVAYGNQGQAAEADGSYQAASGLNPQWKVPTENRSVSVVSGLGLPGLPTSQRMFLIDKYKSNIAFFKPNEYQALNALALGLWRTRRDRELSEYLEKGFTEANRLLHRAVVLRGDAPEAHRNLIGIQEDVLFGDSADIKLSGLLGKLPEKILSRFELRPSPWSPPPPPLELSKETKAVCDRIRTMSGETRKLITHYLTRAKLTEGEVLEAHLHSYGLAFVEEQCAHSPSDIVNARNVQQEAVSKLIEWGAASATAQRLLGAYYLRLKNYPAAKTALARAKDLGSSAEDLTAVLERLSHKPEFFEPRPRRGASFGSGAPLAGISLRIQTCSGPVSAKATVDGREVEALVLGTQVLLPTFNHPLLDGIHKLKINVSDPLGNEASIETDWVVDKKAPTLKLVSPEEQDGPVPMWMVLLDDGDGVGIDVDSIKAEFLSVGQGTTACRDTLILQGVWQKEIAKLGVKADERIAAPAEGAKSLELKLAPQRDLTAGTYQLKVTFADKAGNPNTMLRALKVK